MVKISLQQFFKADKIIDGKIIADELAEILF